MLLVATEHAALPAPHPQEAGWNRPGILLSVPGRFCFNLPGLFEESVVFPMGYDGLHRRRKKKAAERRDSCAGLASSRRFSPYCRFCRKRSASGGNCHATAMILPFCGHGFFVRCLASGRRARFLWESGRLRIASWPSKKGFPHDQDRYQRFWAHRQISASCHAPFPAV